jgi:radical SAM superfamily enzyme YgiQ (UPF0313 family)
MNTTHRPAIALILPRAGIYRYGTGAFSRFIRYSPMTLTTLAALVPPELDAEVRIFDEGIQTVQKEKIRADIVGITGITGASRRTYAYADYFRGRGVYVVIGGVHATLLPEEAQTHADTVVTGQAFESWPQFLRDWVSGKPRKRYDSRKKLDFSLFKTPSRGLLKKSGYVTVNSTQAVFGCPNSCEFCVTPVVCQGYQGRPIPQVVQDIASMKGTYFTFVDPSPIENVRYATDLYRALIPLGKKWTGLATTRLVMHGGLMDVMEQSGCKGLLIGFESLSQSANDAMSKGFSRVKEYRTLARELHSRGIAIMGCFVHGLDGDDPDCFGRTLDFVMEADIDLPRFTICTPFPGTPFFTRLKTEGRILTENWALYDAQHVVFKPARMSVEALEAGHHDIWKRAYTPGAITRRLAGSRTFLRLSIPANLAYRMYARRLPAFSDAYMANDHMLRRLTDDPARCGDDGP